MLVVNMACIRVEKAPHQAGRVLMHVSLTGDVYIESVPCWTNAGDDSGTLSGPLEMKFR